MLSWNCHGTGSNSSGVNWLLARDFARRFRMQRQTGMVITLSPVYPRVELRSKDVLRNCYPMINGPGAPSIKAFPY